MAGHIDQLLDEYEDGRISRRGFLTAVSALLVAGTGKASAQTAVPIQATSFNHVTCFVRDVPATVKFYQDLLGLKVLSEQGIGTNLTTGEGHAFLGIYNGPPNAPLGLDHICFTVKDFNVKEIQRKLAERGIDSRVRMRDDTIPELYFNDLNGVSVQLQGEGYCGGAGYLGDQCGPVV
jgi:catechol 2,3-dioxygenase-like lactoylglutathione lyase family enzyme